MNRIYVAVDVSNLFYSIQKRFNKKVDYRKIMQYCRSRGWVYRAMCYASQMNGKGDDFFNCLKTMGYDIKLKEVKTYVNKGQVTQKANCDIDMAVDILKCVEHFDELVLICSDGDMIPVVKFCQERGVKVHVLACAINSELRSTCDSSTEIGPSLLERENELAATA